MGLSHTTSQAQLHSRFPKAGILPRLWRAWREHWRLRRDLKRLDGMSDRMLRDIGLRRDRFGSWYLERDRSSR